MSSQPYWPLTPEHSSSSSGNNTIKPYLETALENCNSTNLPVHIFNPSSPLPSATSLPNQITTWPLLSPTSKNHIFLFPGSFNPPHQGHLATIHYFHQRRHKLGIIAFFIFADPSSIIQTKEKQYGQIILPQNLRNTLFTTSLSLQPLIQKGWLHFLVGSMESHIQLLRQTTDLISQAGIEAILVGFLGGDKLSIRTSPDQPPGELGEWGPLDEFFIMNARREVDFYSPGAERPGDLPGCTMWVRGFEDDSDEGELGVLWVCKALTVKGQPRIQFRASERSASNGISSTKIRRVMMEAEDDELFEELKDKVLGVDMLVAWLRGHRSSAKAE